MTTAVLCLVLSAAGAEPTSLLEELTTQGLQVPGGGKVKLPAPTLAVGMTKQQKLDAIEKVADEFPSGLFLERSLNAPYPLKVKSIPTSDGDADGDRRRGHTLDLWFVAYGKIEELDKKNVMGTLLGMHRQDGKELVFLSEKDLAARKIQLTKRAGLEERYLVQEMLLIEKILLTGVMRSQKQWIDGSLVSTMLMDERFTADKEFPNRWQAIRDARAADLDLGPPNPYRGFGGYVKATPIPETRDGIFIEMHFAFHEPFDWFEGRNLLASKLPLAVRSNVKKMRSTVAGRPVRRGGN